MGLFEYGQFVVETLVVKSCEDEYSAGSSSHPYSPPKPLLIAHPVEEGLYPVLLFLHGFLLYNSFYTQLISHIASHAFIVVAPQLYNIAGPDCAEEIKSAAAVADWFVQGLQTKLPSNIRPDLTKLGLAGHSRGGKVAFALAKGFTPTLLQFSALVGIDPVDGLAEGIQTSPPVLTYVLGSYDPKMAVLVIGSGLGNKKRGIILPPCAPNGVNHVEFAKECVPPVCHVVARDYGHQDMLDDQTPGLRGKVTYCTCKNGETREPMRRFVGGITIAFLKAYLEKEDGALVDFIQRPEISPVVLSTLEFHPE